MDSINSLDEILEHFHNKIDVITRMIPMAKLCAKANALNGSESQSQSQTHIQNNCMSSLMPINYSNTNQFATNNSNQYIPDLNAISLMTIEMKAMVDEMYAELDATNNAMIADHRNCLNQMNLLENHCQYIKNNIPMFLRQSNKTKCMDTKQENIVTVIQKKTAPKREQTANLEKNVSNSKTNVLPKPVLYPKQKTVGKQDSIYKSFPNINFITTNEYSSIPNYMRGRLSYEEINRAIGDFNRTIACKYKIIAGYSTKYSDEELKKYHNYKEQENTETTGEFFCTLNDLKDLSDLKKVIDTTTRKILTCLRHCRRIKEIRGPNKLIRYAIIKDNNNTNDV